MNWKASKAITEFNQYRGHPIERQNYIDDLKTLKSQKCIIDRTLVDTEHSEIVPISVPEFESKESGIGELKKFETVTSKSYLMSEKLQSNQGALQYIAKRRGKIYKK